MLGPAPGARVVRAILPPPRKEQMASYLLRKRLHSEKLKIGLLTPPLELLWRLAGSSPACLRGAHNSSPDPPIGSSSGGSPGCHPPRDLLWRIAGSSLAIPRAPQGAGVVLKPSGPPHEPLWQRFRTNKYEGQRHEPEGFDLMLNEVTNSATADHLPNALRQLVKSQCIKRQLGESI